MRRFPVLTWLLALALLPGSLGACRKVDEKAGGAKPGAAGGRAAARPQAEGTLTGKIVETMDSGGYTYLRLTTDQGERWAAVRQAPVQVGDQVTVTDAALMKNFASKTLNRTFPEIWFGALGGLGGAGPGGKKGGMMPPGHPPVGGATEGTADEAREAHAKAGASKVALEGPVAKAPGPEGRTVAEVHAHASARDLDVQRRNGWVRFEEA